MGAPYQITVRTCSQCLRLGCFCRGSPFWNPDPDFAIQDSRKGCYIPVWSLDDRTQTAIKWTLSDSPCSSNWVDSLWLTLQLWTSRPSLTHLAAPIKWTLSDSPCSSNQVDPLWLTLQLWSSGPSLTHLAAPIKWTLSDSPCSSNQVDPLWLTLQLQSSGPSLTHLAAPIKWTLSDSPCSSNWVDPLWLTLQLQSSGPSLTHLAAPIKWTLSDSPCSSNQVDPSWLTLQLWSSGPSLTHLAAPIKWTLSDSPCSSNQVDPSWLTLQLWSSGPSLTHLAAPIQWTLSDSPCSSNQVDPLWLTLQLQSSGPSLTHLAAPIKLPTTRSSRKAGGFEEECDLTLMPRQMQATLQPAQPHRHIGSLPTPGSRGGSGSISPLPWKPSRNWRMSHLLIAGSSFQRRWAKSTLGWWMKTQSRHWAGGWRHKVDIGLVDEDTKSTLGWWMKTQSRHWAGGWRHKVDIGLVDEDTKSTLVITHLHGELYQQVVIDRRVANDTCHVLLRSVFREDYRMPEPSLTSLRQRCPWLQLWDGPWR